MELRINSDSRAAYVLINLVHKEGTAKFYINTLTRLFNAVLYNQEDLGMDDTEAIETLRTLALLRADIKDLANDNNLAKSVARVNKYSDTCEMDFGAFPDPDSTTEQKDENEEGGNK